MKNILFFILILFNTNFLSAQNDINVYVFLAEECPICIYMARPLQDVAKHFKDKANFYAVFPTRKSHYKSASLYKKKYKLSEFEIILDKDQILTQKLAASVTPEVVITNDAGELLYQGRISNAYSAPGKMKHGKRTNELKNILAQITDGQEVLKPWKPAVGCYITMNNKTLN